MGTHSEGMNITEKVPPKKKLVNGYEEAIQRKLKLN